MPRSGDLPAPKPETPAPARPRSSASELAAFLTASRATAPRGDAGRGRLIFALDATMSRQPSWDLACHLQAGMFEAASKVGGLEVKLIYFRGHREARASRWVADAAALTGVMQGIACHGGLTQIGRVLDHATREAARGPVAAMVYVGDAMEESIDALCDKAGRLALRNTRAFMFLEGRDPAAETAYREIARLTGGVFLPFDPRAAGELRALLAAIGAFAAGGRAALEATGTAAARRLLADLRP
jgi:hypothetical protein